jgi:YD repeat-containing protein
LSSSDRFELETGRVLTNAYEYDRFGQLTKETSPQGRIKTTDYDTVHNQYPVNECSWMPNSLQGSLCVRKEWNYLTQAIERQTDANTAWQLMAYDAHSRLSKETHSNGECTDYRYLGYGTSTQHDDVDVCDASGNDGVTNKLWISSYFDGFHRTNRQLRASGATKRNQYFGASTVLTGSTPWQETATAVPLWTLVTRDSIGNAYTTTAADGTSTTAEYSSGTRIERDELMRIKKYETDGWGRTAAFTEYLNAVPLVSNYEYDWADRLVKSYDPGRNVTGALYDSLGRRAQDCDPARGCVNYTFFDDGLLRTTSNANNALLTYSYDDLGRKTRRDGSDGRWAEWYYDSHASNPAATFARGRVVATNTSDNVSERFSYDSHGRTLSKTRCVASKCGQLGSTYDQSGLMQLRVYPGSTGALPGTQVAYTYDPDGRVSSVGGIASTVQFDAEGRLTLVNFKNGVKQQWAYNAARGWLNEVRLTDARNGVMMAVNNQFDQAAQLSTRGLINPGGFAKLCAR